MTTHRIGALLSAAALAIGLAACGSSSSSSSSSSAAPAAPSTGSGASSGGGTASSLTGAGSTLVAPLVSQWQSDYPKQSGGVPVTYGALGSGAGIAQITARTVDFGASDAPLSPSQFSAAKGVVQIPWALAATVIAYHLSGAPNQLKLTGPVLADIWLGKIKTWNDPAIAKLNPGAKLPSTAITPVYRTDGSGDTFALTNYFSKVSPQWMSKVGSGTQVQFPTGVGGKGNSGVGGQLSSTNGAIAYIAIAYVLANHFDYALVQNAAGSYPVPGIPSIAAAAAAFKSVPAGNRVIIVDPPASAPTAYPISTFTYCLVPLQSPKAATLKKFLTYAVTTGQKFDASLDFAPLPAPILAVDEQTISEIK